MGWKVVGLLRLSPLVPYSLSNYLYGLTSVTFGPYVLASWAGMLPGNGALRVSGRRRKGRCRWSQRGRVDADRDRARRDRGGHDHADAHGPPEARESEGLKQPRGDPEPSPAGRVSLLRVHVQPREWPGRRQHAAGSARQHRRCGFRAFMLRGGRRARLHRPRRRGPAQPGDAALLSRKPARRRLRRLRLSRVLLPLPGHELRRAEPGRASFRWWTPPSSSQAC